MNLIAEELVYKDGLCPQGKVSSPGVEFPSVAIVPRPESTQILISPLTGVH